MNREELNKKVEKLENDLTEAKKELSNCGKRWKPELETCYYYVTLMGRVVSDCWINHSVDIGHYNLNNCFKTREEAEFKLENLKVTAELEIFAQEHNECELDWSDWDQPKYYMFYGHTSGRVKSDYTCVRKEHRVYFSSQEIQEQAIETIGADRIKKYYFGVV